jgi:23S rRNA (adenine2503-C2)-methyltransferase
MTLSTAGLVAGIERLAEEPLFPNLSISMTGATNGIRDILMPVNRRYPIEQVVDAVRRLPAARRKRVMFEYVVIKGLTDSIEDAARLAAHLKGIGAKVNLIPLNPAPEIPFERPAEEDVLRFQDVLLGSGVNTFIRRNRGNDISAACGQLRRKAG